MTISPERPGTDAQSSLASLRGWATDARTVLAALGIVLYAVLRIAYSLFYSNFGLTPDDLGLGYLDLLIQSAVGMVILLLAIFVVVAAVVGVSVGLYRLCQMAWFNYQAQRHREFKTMRPRSGGTKARRAIRAAPGLGGWALLVLTIVGIVVGLPVLVLLGFFVFMAQALLVGIKQIDRGLTGEHHARWRLGIVTIALATLGLAIFSLLARAESDAARVQHGHASGFALQDFRITTWGAEDATVSWTSNQIAADLRPLAGRCLMYFGQSNGTAFLYLVSTHEMFRVPTAVAVVRTRPAVCSRE